nr:MAG TPA: hypothetical protein [Caudoviricetes sp.]DAS87131.1 MAG TPA: hypothetical protein [Caudoviricetes sp.]
MTALILATSNSWHAITSTTLEHNKRVHRFHE